MALSAYLCEEGLVIDFAQEISREAEQCFLEKWVPRMERGLSRREERQLRQENPLNDWHRCSVRVNGEQIKSQHSSGSFWIPPDLRPEIEPCDDKMEARLEHYALDSDKVWIFRRVYCDWVQGKPEAIASLEATLIGEYVEVCADSFAMPQAGESVTVINPLTEQAHILTVTDIQKESITIPERFGEYEMPAEATVMCFTLTPNLKWEAFQLKDTQEKDQARKKDGTPYNGGSVDMMLRMPRDGTRVAVSSMRFTAPDRVEWEPVFREKRVEDLVLELL